jgi:tetratricopeptide (TPR) repeat protein
MQHLCRARTLWSVLILAAVSGCESLGPGPRMLVAEVAVERGEFPSAAREYRLAAAASRDAAIAEHAARLAFDNGQDSELERGAREWLGRDAHSEAARRFDAVALLQLDRRAAAAEQFARLIPTAYPTPAEAFSALTESLADLRNDTGAARTVALLAQRYPDVPEAPYAVGTLALSAGDSPTALASAARALELRPSWREARWLAARAHVAGGDCTPGLEAASALAAEAGDADRLLYAWLLAACERPAEARPYFEDLARGNTLKAEAFEGLAALELDAGRLDDAGEHYMKILATGRNTERAFYGLATVADRKGDVQRAARLYARVTSGARAVPAQLRAYRLLLGAGQPFLAARQLDEFIATAVEGRIAVTAGRAQILAELGRSDDAHALLARAIATYPDREELRYALATVLEHDGKVDAALAELRGVLRVRPLDPTAENALGFTLADHSRSLPEAETLIRAALADKPDSAAIRDSLGWVLYRRGQSAAAVDWLKRAYAGEPDPEIAAHLGEAEWASGDQAAAQATWRAALERSPGDPHVEAAVARHGGRLP